MALNLNNLSQDEQFAAAAEFAGVPESVLRSQWRVESSNGTHLTSPAGARGHFQTMPATQAVWEERTGRKYDPDNFADSLTLAALTMRENLALAGGDVGDALRIYHGGTSRANWGPVTEDYVAKVLGGNATTASPVAGLGAAALNDQAWGGNGRIPAAEVQLNNDAWQGVPLPDNSEAAQLRAAAADKLSDFEKGLIAEAQYGTAAQAAAVGSSTIAAEAYAAGEAVNNNLAAATRAYIERARLQPVDADASNLSREYTVAESYFREVERIAQSQGISDYWNAAFSSTLAGQAVRMFQNRDIDQGYVQGWRYIDHIDEIETPDMTAREREMLRQANSPGEVEYYQREIQQLRVDGEILGTLGTTGQLAYGLGAGIADPLGWVAGLGIGKAASLAGIGARAYAQAGRPIAALAAGAAEGAVGNVLTAATLDAMGAYYTGGDYLEDLGMGLLFGTVLTIPEAARSSSVAHAMIAEGARRRMEVAVEAQRRAGPDASPEQIQKHIADIEAEQNDRFYKAMFNDIPDQDRLMARPDVDERVPGAGVDDAPEAAPQAPEQAPAPEPVSQPEVSPEPTRAPEAPAPEPTPAPEQAPELAGTAAQPNQYNGDVTAELQRAAEHRSAPQLLRDVAKSQNVPAPYRVLAAKLAQLAEAVKLEYDPNRAKTLGGRTGGVYYHAEHMMTVRIPRTEFVLHEAIHGVTTNLILSSDRSKLPESIRAPIERLERLVPHIQKHAKKLPDDMPDGVKKWLRSKGGPISDAQELIAYGMTSDKMQRWLATVPAPESGPFQNAWQWFKEQVAELLGLSGASRTAFDEVMEAGGALLDAVGDNKDIAEATIRGRAAWLRELVAQQRQRTASSAKAEQPRAPVNSAIPTKRAYKALVARYQLDQRIPDNTTRRQVAEFIARAERIVARNQIDPQRLRTILTKGDLEATSTTMLSSDSPVAKAIGIMLMENPEGAAGRRPTAALQRAQFFEQYVGTTIREVNSAYNMWAKEQKVGALRASMDADLHNRFYREVASEMDRRWNNRTAQADAHPMVKLAADVFDHGYRRMGKDQKFVGVVGAERIDLETSGYFQRRWNLGKVAEAMRDPAKMSAFVDMLEDQFRTVAGFSDGDEFSVRELAVTYAQRIVHKATGMTEVPANLFSDDTATILRESLTALRLNEEEIQKVVSRFSRGGAGHTKGRIDMDLGKQYTDSDGNPFSPMDYIDHNLPELYRKYAARVAGDVALAKHGIMGDAGIKVLREALTATGSTPKQLRAFDQFMSEMTGRPVGDGDPQFLQNARILTGASRLGGALFPQLGAYIDATMAVGIGHTLRSVKDVPRLMGEVRKLARGEEVKNPILSGLETLGPEFGLSDYRIMGMFDVGEQFEVYGQETVGVTGRAVRYSGNAVRIMSGHRATVAVQTRGIAEQIVQKAWRYIRDGGEDKALADMGFNEKMVQALRDRMHEVVEFDSSGNLKVFDPRNVGEGGEQLMIAFRDAVYRGAGQIIQREFPGEVGKWAHSGLLKMLFQFRTFSLVAHQKQLGRNLAVHGSAKAFGYMLGAISFAMPIHAARVLAKAVLMEDSKRDEFLDEQLHPLTLARASMNYIGLLGLMPDVLDVGTGAAAGWADTAGVDLPAWAKSTGGRTMAQTDLIGGQFAPAVGVVNDLGQGLFGNPSKLIRTMPGNNLPYIQPIWLGAESELKD